MCAVWLTPAVRLYSCMHTHRIARAGVYTRNPPPRAAIVNTNERLAAVYRALAARRTNPRAGLGARPPSGNVATQTARPMVVRNARPGAGTAPRRPPARHVCTGYMCSQLAPWPAFPQFVHRPFSGKFLMPLNKLLKPEPDGAGATALRAAPGTLPGCTDRENRCAP